MRGINAPENGSIFFSNNRETLNVLGQCNKYNSTTNGDQRLPVTVSIPSIQRPKILICLSIKL